VNPRYLAYCLAHARTPDEMREADSEDWPGGKMTGFILWMSRRWSQWAKLRGYNVEPASVHRTVLTNAHHADFDAWLATFAADEAKHGPRSSSVTT